MAHNLWIRDGQAAMFYVGDKPWHELGTELKQPATAAQALAAAQLDWRVVKAPLYLFGKNRLLPAQGRYAVVPEDRFGTDECPVFGIVGEQYQPLQNREAFSFFDPIVGEGAAIYHTAGALGQGERIWMLAQLPGDIVVAGREKVEKYVLLSNSHDGESSIQVKFTPIRVVCENTLTLALSYGRTVRVAHLGDMQQRLEQARKLLGFMNETFRTLESRFNAMVAVKLNGEALEAYLQRVFPNPKDPDDHAAMKRAENNRHWAGYFFARGKGNNEPAVKGTLWAAYNGVTEFVDHCDRRQNPVVGPDPKRLQSVWFGEGYQAKARAYASAEEMVPA